MTKPGSATGRLRVADVVAHLDALGLAAARAAVLRSRITALRDHVAGHGADTDEFALAPLCRAVLGHDDVNRLRDFRFELNLLAQDRKFGFMVDGQKRTASTERRCWFEGEPVTPDWLAEQLAAMLHGLGPTVDARVRTAGTIPPLRVIGERRVNVLIAHAHADDNKVRTLRTMLRDPVRAVAPGWEIVFNDLVPLAGEHRAGVGRRFDDASVVVVAVSAALLMEQQAKPGIVPAAVFDQAPVLPVAIEALPRTAALGLLGELEWLPKFTGPKERSLSVTAIADRIGEILRDVAPVPLLPAEPDHRWLHGLGRRRKDGPDTGDLEYMTQYEPARVVAQDLDRRRRHGNGEDLMTCLTRWLLDPVAQPYFALLGEYGMGKTTASQVFAKLIDAHREDGWPDVILFDLRTLSDNMRRSDPTLEAILDDLLRRNYKTGSLGPVATPQQVLDRVQNHGALVIYDGLDEVMVAQTDKQRQQFVRELLRTLPPSRADQTDRDSGRVLLTCRTHHFRTIAEEHSFFRGEDRDGVEHRYRAAYLLPFNAEQIRAYLQNHVADRPGGVAKAMELIGRVHNLSELAARPVNLRMIVDLLARIETRVATGSSINAAALYTELVERWFDRDSGKHQFVREHKLRLMEDLAGHLIRAGVRSIPVGELENWLRSRVRQIPEINDWFQLARTSIDVLCEDLRTATFIVRPGDDHFEFAHTSLLEYFHARQLCAALQVQDASAWAVAGVSAETISFLLDIVEDLDSGERARVRAGFETLVKTFTPMASQLLLRVAVAASGRTMQIGSTAGFDLRGMDWPDLIIDGPFDLTHARLAGATLRRARLTNVDLRGADLSGTVLVQAEFVDCDTRGASFADVDFAGATLRRCRADSESRHLETGNRPAILPGDIPSIDLPTTRVARYGHNGPVSSVAWSPDNTRILTGSADGTARVFDATTGQQLLTLPNHNSPVWSVAWSPDNTRILTASNDNTARVFDATTGQQLLTLPHHNSWVSSVAWSPDNTRILTGTRDTARVFDATTGQQLLTLPNRNGPVLSVAWSPDNTRILTGSHDGTVRVFDSSTGIVAALSFWLLPEGNAATVRNDQEVIAMTDGSWRWLRLEIVDNTTRAPSFVPVETFGPIPAYQTTGG